MKRPLWLAAGAMLLAPLQARANCPVPYKVTGPGGLVYDVMLDGYARVPGDNGGTSHVPGQLAGGTTIQLGAVTTASGVYPFGWDSGGYGWETVKVGDGTGQVVCPTLYFALSTPAGQVCSDAALGAGATPSCGPHFVISTNGAHQFSCTSLCDYGFQVPSPYGTQPPVIGTPRAYPNPLRGTGQINFASLPSFAAVRIMDFDGKLVTQLAADALGNAAWPGNDQEGRAVASGVYLVLVSPARGASITLKVAVQR